MELGALARVAPSSGRHSECGDTLPAEEALPDFIALRGITTQVKTVFVGTMSDNGSVGT
jgi:hypothetical protein